jgi:hypothetical protein
MPSYILKGYFMDTTAYPGYMITVWTLILEV